MAAPGKDLTTVRALLPADAPMVAVPSEFAGFVGNQVLRIEIRHHGLGHDGAADVWASTTWLMTVPHVMNVFLRMMWLGEEAGPVPGPCSRPVSASDCGLQPVLKGLS